MAFRKSNIVHERVVVISDLFCDLGFDNIVKFDVLEPEFHTLKRLFESGVRCEYLGLVAVSAGSIDFQLGLGGAEKFWSLLNELAKRFKSLNDLEQVEFLMKVFLSEPINARSLRIKTARIRRLFNSGFARWLISNYDELRMKPILLWRKLADILKTDMKRKTIVFAMKAFDLSHLICFGDYANFPPEIPIPVDFHIRNVTISSGLLKNYGSDDEVRKAWAMVLKNVREKRRRNITLLRLDSLVWQAGKIMYANSYLKELCRKEIEKYMIERVKLSPRLACRLAEELTVHIENVKVG